MTNQEIIKKKFASFSHAVRDGGNLALCDQLKRTMEQSINLHAVLEDGVHTHHQEESDSHGWAVADGNAIVDSGASDLLNPNVNGSAENEAVESAISGDGSVSKGVFAAVMADFDSLRFESKIQELLKESVVSWFPTYYLKNCKSTLRK